MEEIQTIESLIRVEITLEGKPSDNSLKLLQDYRGRQADRHFMRTWVYPLGWILLPLAGFFLCTIFPTLQSL